MKIELRGHERADRDGEQERGGGHDPPGALESDRDSSVVGHAAVVRFLDPRDQEDAVVGGEPEGDREEQDRLGRVERARAPVGEQALQASVLEDQDEDSEHGAEAERVHQHRLHSEHERAGHQEEDDQRRGDDEREHEGEVRAEAVLEVDVSGRIARDAEVERRS